MSSPGFVRPLKVSGLIAAPFTAFDPRGVLRLELIASQSAALHEAGVVGAFVCGTTGEGSSLSSAERMEVAREWRAVRPARLKLFVHVGHASLPESCRLAAHAQEVGADAIASIAPSRPAGMTELVAWCGAVAASAPDLPFYYYHMPEISGVTLAAADFLDHAAERIPTLAGIKFTHEDLMDFQLAARTHDARFDVMFGRDQFLLAALALGATGAVGSTYNFAAPLYRRLMEDYAQGRLSAAQTAQRQAAALVALLRKSGGLAAGKAVMEMLGLDCGPLRLPQRALNADEKRALFARIEELGVLSAT